MPHTFTSAADVAKHLQSLVAERAAAAHEGLLGNATYSRDLDAEIDFTRVAYIGAAVTEIATLRGELSGRPQG